MEILSHDLKELMGKTHVLHTQNSQMLMFLVIIMKGSPRKKN